VNVLPEYQGKGIGTFLVKKAIDRIKKKREARFVLLATKKPRFYNKFGFKVISKIGKGECLMILGLKNYRF